MRALSLGLLSWCGAEAFHAPRTVLQKPAPAASVMESARAHTSPPHQPQKIKNLLSTIQEGRYKKQRNFGF